MLPCILILINLFYRCFIGVMVCDMYWNAWFITLVIFITLLLGFLGSYKKVKISRVLLAILTSATILITPVNLDKPADVLEMTTTLQSRYGWNVT